MNRNGSPENWEKMLLGNVCRLKNGYAFKSTNYKDEGIPIIRISDINSGSVSIDNSVRVNEDSEYLDFTVKMNDILIAMSGATTGKFGIFKSKELAYQNQRVGKFQIKDSKILDNTFLFYLLHSLKRQIEKDAYGGAQPNISSSKIEAMQIPVPPLFEQQRIVSKIEELFSELDKGIESLKTARQQLKVYRQAVLKWAFEGKRFSSKWTWITLENISDKITDGEHLRPKTQEKGILFLSAKDVRNEGVSFEDPLFISEDTARKSWERCNPQKGDILIVSRGATVGRMCIVNTDEKFCLLGSVILIKLSKSVNNKFICYALKSPATNQIITSISGATAQQAIYLRDIKNIEIPVCSLHDQQMIVEEIESRLSVCDKIEETIEQSLKQAEALRQSILKKAFEGKLVPQDPNDEPASKLLERISAAKQATKNSKHKIQN